MIEFELEYNRFQNIVERFINPTGIESGIFSDTRVLKGIVNKTESYLQDANGVKDEIRRAYFFKNPNKLNEILFKLDPTNKIKHSKLICSLTNLDIVNSFSSFGAPESQGAFDEIMGYGVTSGSQETSRGKKINKTLPLYKSIVSVITELPALTLYDAYSNFFAPTYRGDEYYFLNVPCLNLIEFREKLKYVIRKAREKQHLNMAIQKVINALIVHIGNSNYYINVHVYRTFYELRISYSFETGEKISNILREIVSLNPLYYYYAPIMLRTNVIKLCIVGSIKDKEKEVQHYINQIAKLTPVFEINDPILG